MERRQIIYNQSNYMGHKYFIEKENLKEVISNAETQKALDRLTKYLEPLAKSGWKEKLWYQEVLSLRAQWRRNMQTKGDGQDKSRIIDENLIRILDEMENPSTLVIIKRLLLEGGKQSLPMLAAKGIVGLIGLIVLGFFYFSAFGVKTNSSINKDQCWIRTGQRTSLYHSPEFMPTRKAFLPNYKEYLVLETTFEEKTGKPFFKIEDKKRGSGWVRDFGLDVIADKCLEE